MRAKKNFYNWFESRLSQEVINDLKICASRHQACTAVKQHFNHATCAHQSATARAGTNAVMKAWTSLMTLSDDGILMSLLCCTWCASLLRLKLDISMLADGACARAQMIDRWNYFWLQKKLITRIHQSRACYWNPHASLAFCCRFVTWSFGLSRKIRDKAGRIRLKGGL